MEVPDSQLNSKSDFCEEKGILMSAAHRPDKGRKKQKGASRLGRRGFAGSPKKRKGRTGVVASVRTESRLFSGRVSSGQIKTTNEGKMEGRKKKRGRWSRWRPREREEKNHGGAGGGGKIFVTRPSREKVVGLREIRNICGRKKKRGIRVEKRNRPAKRSNQRGHRQRKIC